MKHNVDLTVDNDFSDLPWQIIPISDNVFRNIHNDVFDLDDINTDNLYHIMCGHIKFHFEDDPSDIEYNEELSEYCARCGCKLIPWDTEYNLCRDCSEKVDENMLDTFHSKIMEESDTSIFNY